jgi:hypothetical protein
VCMCVCVCMCVYVCMCVCMVVCMYECMYVWKIDLVDASNGEEKNFNGYVLLTR